MIALNFKQILTENILPFWLDNAIDEENGGIFTCLDREGNIYGTEKSVWFQGRALWTFSKAYNYVCDDKRYLNAAEKIYKFLPKCEDSDGRMFFTVTKEGNPIQKRRYYFSETFAAIGCAQFFKATGDENVWKNAEKYFNMAKKCFDNPAMNEPKLRTSLKALSPVMIMLSTARVMAECAPCKEKYDKLCDKYVKDILDGGFISYENKVLLENVSEDGKFVDTPTGRLVNPGHSLETAWFLMIEGLLNNDDKILEAAKYIVDITMPVGLDKEHGGIIAFCDALGKPATSLEWDMKLWWPQNEAIIANRLAYEIFKEEKYKNNYEMLLEYAFDKFSDNEYGEWYGYLHYDSTVSNHLKGNIFKGPFHLPRMLMILDGIEKGNIIDMFS